jgi:hypothetical protein
MTAEQLHRRDMKRDIGKELLQAVREMKAGKAAQIHRFDDRGTAILGGRRKSRLSLMIENTTLEHLIAESTRTGKEFRTLINEALAKHVFVDRRPATAAEVRKIVRQELSRSAQERTTQQPRRKKVRVRPK